MFKESIDSLASHLENLISTKTVVGEPFTAGDVTIIPLITATFGLGTGVGEATDPGKAGGKGTGGGAGGKVAPIALIAIKGNEIQVYPVGAKSGLEKITEMIPEIMAKFSAHHHHSHDGC
jgi:uncharacterized spore protein YtfJ